MSDTNIHQQFTYFTMCHVRPVLRGTLLMQLHAYVTYMSLKQPALDEWKACPVIQMLLVF